MKSVRNFELRERSVDVVDINLSLVLVIVDSALHALLLLVLSCTHFGNRGLELEAEEIVVVDGGEEGFLLL